MRSFVRPLGAVAVASLAACSPQTTSVVVPSLEKPGPAAFACYSTEERAFRASLTDCDGTDDALRIHSFVLETATGEVAVVDWETQRAIDSDRTVPGFTFVRVGESPSAIVIPDDDARMTFVANYGSYTVQSIETASFVPDAIQDDAGALTPTEIVLPSGPTDLAYVATSSGRWLYAALPDVGAIARIPVDATDGSLGTPTILAVSSTVPAAVAPSTTDDYLRICHPDDFARSAAATPRTPVSRGATPRPAQLAVIEREGGAIQLVATDEWLPMLHVFDVGSGTDTELAGFATAVPTLDVVATPPVPATYVDASTANGANAQYVYAIDATDRSVLVVEVGSGAVQAVNVGERAPDRIPYDAGAITLETLTPGFDPDVDERCDPSDTTDTRRSSASPTALRGVFVAVALVDGTVGFVDVYDLDAPCRGTTECGGVGNSNDELVYVHRHRPRVGQLATIQPGIATTLSFSYQGSIGRLTSTGEPAGDGPGLLPVDDGDDATDHCPGTASTSERGQMRAALVASGDASVDGQPLFCLLDDPAAIRAQRWFATYEGSLAAAQGVRGRLVDDAGTRRFLTEDGTFCGWGVLGRDDVTASGLASTDPESDYGGDMLVISADLPPERVDDVRCDGLAIPTSGTRRIRIAFEILEAFEDELVLGDFVPDTGYALFSELNQDPAGAFETVAYCFPQLVSYDVRARGAYVVASNVSDERHRVIDDGSGRCRVDVAGQPYDPAEPDTARAVRAIPGRTFVHPQVAFRISDFAVPSGISAQLVFDVTTIPALLRVDGGTLGSALEYNPADSRLYTVDIASHTISQFDLDPITRIDRVQ